MKKEDPSDTAKSVDKYIEGYLTPNDKRKETFNSLLKQGDNSVKLYGSFMRGFNNTTFLQENKEFHDEYFKVLTQVFKDNSREYSKEFYNSMYPNGDDLEGYQQKTKEVLSKVDAEKDPWLTKILKTSINELKRKITCYKCFMDAIKSQ